MIFEHVELTLHKPDIEIEADSSQTGTTKSVYVEIGEDLTPAALSKILFAFKLGNTTVGSQDEGRKLRL